VCASAAAPSVAAASPWACVCEIDCARSGGVRSPIIAVQQLVPHPPPDAINFLSLVAARRAVELPAPHKIHCPPQLPSRLFGLISRLEGTLSPCVPEGFRKCRCSTMACWEFRLPGSAMASQSQISSCGVPDL